MRYYVSLDPSNNDDPTPVDVRELPTGKLQIELRGQQVDVDVVEVGGQLSIRIDGKMVDLTTEGVPPEIGAICSGHRSYVCVESDRHRAAEAAKSNRRSSTEKVVKSPMPGRVVKLHVKAGDTVAPGQSLLVLEAMKMENEVKSTIAAVIREVHVVEGATVESNARLITLD